jgi:hypothetical protein
MQIPILIEPIAGNGYRANSGQPLAMVVEVPTREEALARLKEQLEARLRNGAELVPLDLTPPKHPWMEFAGMFKGDPLLEEWKEAMAEYRRKMDEDPDSP